MTVAGVLSRGHTLNVKVSLEAGQEDGGVVVIDREVGSRRTLLGGREGGRGGGGGRG